LSSFDQVSGQLSLPCAARRCDVVLKVTPVMTAVVDALAAIIDGGGAESESESDWE
jgi:hypothetical protein